MKLRNYFLLIAQVLLNLPSLIFLTALIIKGTIVMDGQLLSYLTNTIELFSFIAILFAIITLAQLPFRKKQRHLAISLIISIFTLLFSAYTLNWYSCDSIYSYYICLARDCIFKTIH